ncbi:serine hydrolase domain-containing protein [Micromonospora sp. NPDC051925]|uniref:serine hydrolase domain-containing protein n=1 Tax=Micromonospora sp. NPDC051925 TaxID=3364288 RepID=UPI0037CC5450
MRFLTRNRVLLSAISGVLLVLPTTPPAVAAPGTTRHDRGGVLQQLLDAEHAAGMPGVFAEVRTGRRTWQGASGVADVDTGRPVRPGFQHRVGSITKTFVATALLQLEAEHRVRLDAPIGHYLPDLLPGETGRQVTVRMLLNHTSGLGDYPDAILRTVDDFEALRHRTFTPQELVQIGLSLPATHAPGVAYSYSNTNYIVLGMLLEHLTGGTVAAEVGRRILRPLGLRDTYFPGTRTHIRGPHSRAYVPLADGTLGDFSVYNMSWGWAAGEIVSTPHDVNRFYRALLAGRLLPPAQLAAMQTIVPNPTDPTAGYGLGLSWAQLPCGPVWGHTGGVIGHATYTFHRADGSRQVTLAENLIRYAAPGQSSPINRARSQFLVAALCGTEPDGTR